MPNNSNTTPPKSPHLIIPGAIAAVCIITAISSISSLSNGTYNKKGATIFGIISCIMIGLICLFYCISEYNTYKEEKEMYEKNPVALKQKRIAEAKQKEKEELITHWRDVYNSSPNTTPKCPVCDSYNTTKISNIERMASTELLGLASSKIGKQYKCRHCGHMW